MIVVIISFALTLLLNIGSYDCFRSSKLISQRKWIHSSNFSPWFLKSGGIESWLSEQGCKAEDFKISFTDKDDKGKRPFARANIKEGDLLLSLPISFGLDSSKIPAKLSQAINLSYLQTKELGKLALLLLYERSLGKESKYFTYIQTLPHRVPGILSWSDDEISELLQSSTRNYAILFEAIQNDLDYLLSSSIYSLLKGSKEDLVRDFRWALGIVKSRRIRLEEKWSLVPGLDSISYDPFAENEAIVSSAGLFGGKTIKVVSDRPYAKGEEVFMSYGIKSSAQCLEDHGILLSTTDPGDLTSEISVAIDEDNDPYPGDKIGILEENELRPTTTFDLYGDISISGDNGGIDNELLRFLRLKLISGKDSFILEGCFSNTVFSTLALPFSRNNEIDVMNYLRQFCQSKLDTINTISSEEKDGQYISENKNVVSPKLLIARLRDQERKVLQANIDYLKIQLDSLQGPADFREYYQERRLKELDLLRPLDESEVVPID